MSKPATPARLGKKARKFWVDTVGFYDLRVDEARILEDACREIDLIERMEDTLNSDTAELVVSGSMGQPVANPLVQELRQHRGVVARLLKQLDLPDEPSAGAGTAATGRSVRGREAMESRWGQRGA